MYTIRYTEDAKNDLLRLQRNEPNASLQPLSSQPLSSPRKLV